VKRPVWLFSLDTEQFTFIPLVTGTLKAYYDKYGRMADSTDISLVHFRYHTDAQKWMARQWEGSELRRARAAVADGVRPVAAFSCYTWNVPTFLDMIQVMRRTCPEVLVIAGGPHVQNPQQFLERHGIDAIVMGEGEITFTELLDAERAEDFARIPGVACLDGAGKLAPTTPRPRIRDLDCIPSAVAVAPFADSEGRPYRWAAYETMRGCPFRCAYCQWGTGAIGVNISRFSLDRVRADLIAMMEAGIEGVLFCDSNFGALPDDLEKAETLVSLSHRLGRPTHFATCWSKTHTPRVRQIARLLHQHRLLEHYTMALQTLTPAALKLSNRINMSDYESAARDMARDGIPIVSELIWGLPGETLRDFEANLDKLTKVFPSHTIYPYAMLPGTDLFEKRHEYRIETVELAPYGEARADYIVACHSFDREEGLEGYLLITAYIVLYRGNIMPLTVRYVALRELGSISRILRMALRALLEQFRAVRPHFKSAEATEIFEKREFLYRWILGQRETVFETIRATVAEELERDGFGAAVPEVCKVLRLDQDLCPREQHSAMAQIDLGFDALRVYDALERMELPPQDGLDDSGPRPIAVQHGWDFGEELVPKYLPAPAGGLRARYPVWP
jgi:radical SAM superfamily enzyme YgiQ (UPF0313 family)